MSFTPADFGLPPKFTTWREGQVDAIIAAASYFSTAQPNSIPPTSQGRFFVLAAPTGSGKSPEYMSIPALTGAKRALFVTVTKHLQKQSEDDFAPMGLVVIQGKSNYPCLAVRPGGELVGLAPPDTSCDEGPCHAGVVCGLREKGCTYYDQERLAKSSRLVSANISYWMAVNKYAESPIGSFDLLVIDEAHRAAESLAEFVSIYIDSTELKQLLGAALPPLDAGIDYWADWAKQLATICEGRLTDIRGAKGSVKEVRRYQRLGGKLEDLGMASKWVRGNALSPNVSIPGMASDWVAERHSHGVTFSPIWAHGYAEPYLFAGSPNVLLTSATIAPADLAYLGLNREDFTYYEQPSTFPVARRPVYLYGSISVRYGMSRGEEMMWMNYIDNIIAARPGVRIIVHGHSYERCDLIKRLSKHGNRMIVPSKFSTGREVERFKASVPGTAILVSPAVSEGYDFIYDYCRVQIIAKVPFIDMKPLVVQARKKVNKKWIDLMAVQKMEQQAGRIMRAPDDWGETWVVDKNAKRVLSRVINGTLMMKWFQSAVRWADVIPPMPKFSRSKG